MGYGATGEQTPNAERPMLNEIGLPGRQSPSPTAMAWHGAAATATESAFIGGMKQVPEQHLIKRLLPLNNQTVFARGCGESR